MTRHWRDLLDPDGPIGRYLDWDEVARSAGLSRTTAWRLRRAGQFPDPYPLSPGRVGYREPEIEAWKRWRAGRPSRALGRPRPEALGSPTPVPTTVPVQAPAPRPPSGLTLPLFPLAPAARAAPSRSARRIARTGADQIAFDF